MSKPILLANRRIRTILNSCKLITRKLRGIGRITVQKNVEVTPNDVIGQYKLTAGFTKVNVAQALKVSSSEVPKFLNKTLGQTIFKGELLAFKKGLFGKSEITAPTDGVFDSLDSKTGEIILKLIPRDVTLTSGVFGIVENVDHQKGEIVIKSMVSEIYGVLGTGGNREGVINVIAGEGDLVSKEKINETHTGQIIVAGALIMEETIKKALSHSVSGIISGGMNMDDYLSMTNSLNPLKRVGAENGLSIIAAEGFGLVPIGEDFYKILQKHSGKFGIIQGNLGRLLLPSDDPNSILTCRKVGLPFKEALGVRPELSIEEIKVGGRVRLIATPFMGAQGEILAIDETPTKLESGISTYLLTVGTRLKKIKVPFSNIEII